MHRGPEKAYHLKPDEHNTYFCTHCACTQTYPLIQTDMHAAAAGTNGTEDLVANISTIQRKDEDGEC